MRSMLEQPAFRFTLSDSDGSTYRLDDYRGSWLLMVFHRHLG
jgi:peroxiredoxin